METENKEIKEATEDVAAALADVDPDDTKAFYERVSQILDEIHAGKGTMSDLFKHPVWVNGYSRSAVICLLALVPLGIVGGILPTYSFVWIRMACTLILAILILMSIVYRQAQQKHDPYTQDTSRTLNLFSGKRRLRL